jgi:hypothetical protein
MRGWIRDFSCPYFIEKTEKVESEVIRDSRDFLSLLLSVLVLSVLAPLLLL